GTADLVVLASSRPITYDRTWLAQLIGPGGQLQALSREWLSIDGPDQYFGRQLLGDSGVARLIARATFGHSDDRPSLEFVAARRFLDPGAAANAVFDSLVQLGTRETGASPFTLLRILAARRSDAGLLPYLDAARRAGSARYLELAAVAALRAGRYEDAAAGFVELLDFALRRENGPALVRECWASQDSTARTGAAGHGAARGVQEKH